MWFSEPFSSFFTLMSLQYVKLTMKTSFSFALVSELLSAEGKKKLARLVSPTKCAGRCFPVSLSKCLNSASRIAPATTERPTTLQRDPEKSEISSLTKYKQLRGQIESHHLALEILVVARLHVNRRANAEAICLNLRHLNFFC